MCNYAIGRNSTATFQTWVFEYPHLVIPMLQVGVEVTAMHAEHVATSGDVGRNPQVGWLGGRGWGGWGGWKRSRGGGYDGV